MFCDLHIIQNHFRNEIDFIKHVGHIHFNPGFHRFVKQGTYDHNWGTGAEIHFDENVGQG
ncbi:MAG: hypothetical protein E3K37_17285 [Candidatus Kuenenia sp.]|nr:hypothetical protein [Candidatus Kuenenia hertensis]